MNNTQQAEKESIGPWTRGFGWSVAVCAVLNAVLVVIKEKNPAVLAELKKIAGHQWTGHVAIILILFLLAGTLFAMLGKSPGSANRLTAAVVIGTLAGALAIIGFYLLVG